MNDLILENNEFLFHAGTKSFNGKTYSNGGRVLNIVIRSNFFKSARDKALSLLAKFLFKKDLFINKTVSQSFFLKKLGIIERANILIKRMSFKEKSDLYYRLERLLSEKKMGKLFKVLFASNKETKFNLGFK